MPRASSASTTSSAVADAVNGFDAAALAGQLQAFTAASETVYYAALRRFLAEIDIESGDASIADLRHLLRASSWDAWFEPRRLMAAVTETLRGMGIELGEQANVVLDMEHRPNKTPRAVCVPVRVPGDVRLVMQPRGGHEDYAAALHEIGHVEHFALTDASLPAADRHAGDASVTEGYATLLQGLLSEPAWLAEHLGMPPEEIAGFVDFAAFRKLYLLRRYAAKLLYELRLLRDPDPAVGTRHLRRHARPAERGAGPGGELAGGRRRQPVRRSLPALLDAARAASPQRCARRTARRGGASVPPATSCKELWRAGPASERGGRACATRV